LDVERGMVWADAFMVVPDANGTDRLVCHYAHMESLDKMLDHGLARYDDTTQQFARLKSLGLDLADPRLEPVRR
jgi:6-phosphogluconate dehydrogenase (decarboxylating)